VRSESQKELTTGGVQPPFRRLEQKRIVVSVISDLATDVRVQKVCGYLQDKGAAVVLIGRKFSDSLPLETQPFRCIRMHTLFRKGVLQYIEFTIRLWVKLFFYKADVFVANDLDTLLPNYLHAFFRRKKLVYDSHEFFTGVPELLHSPVKRKIWIALEKFLLHRVKYAYTVNESIQQLYLEKYGINMKVVRNMPVYKKDEHEYNSNKPHILIMPGAGINKDRGYEEAIEAMQFLPDEFVLQIIGSGTILPQLKALTEKLNLSNKVSFLPKVSPSVLKEYTNRASLGLTLDKGTSTNSLYSLPNKLFNYIHSGIPVLASDLPEVKKIVEQYAVGVCIKEVNAKAIADGVLQIFADSAMLNIYIENTKEAAKALSWQHEEKILDTIYDPLTG